MNNKRGLLGAIILALMISALFIALFVYWQIRTTGLTIQTGDVEVNLKYNPQENPENNENQDDQVINESENESNNDLHFELGNTSLGFQNLTNNMTNQSQ